LKSNRKKVADRGDIVRFSIGEFSRITSLTIKSLRLYHEKEILIPAEVDKFTGYRYYNDANFEPCFPIPKGEDMEGISVRELKGGKAVTLIHKGPYETIGDSYKKVFAYIHEKGYNTKLPTREVYLKGPGMIFRGKPNN